MEKTKQSLVRRGPSVSRSLHWLWCFYGIFFLLPFSLNPVIISLSCAFKSAGEFLKNHWSPFLSCCCCCLVAKSCPTLCDPVDHSPPGSSIHGILQARILEWVAISFSRASSQPRDQTHVSCLSVCVCMCVNISVCVYTYKCKLYVYCTCMYICMLCFFRYYVKNFKYILKWEQWSLNWVYEEPWGWKTSPGNQH